MFVDFYKTVELYVLNKYFTGHRQTDLWLPLTQPLSYAEPQLKIINTRRRSISTRESYGSHGFYSTRLINDMQNHKPVGFYGFHEAVLLYYWINCMFVAAAWKRKMCIVRPIHCERIETNSLPIEWRHTAPTLRDFRIFAVQACTQGLWPEAVEPYAAMRSPGLPFRLRNDLYCVGWEVKLCSLPALPFNGLRGWPG